MVTLVISTEAHAVPGPPQGHWTYADWEKLPDDGNRYEIIDGVLYMTTAPSSFHQWITGRLWKYLGLPAADLGLAFPFNAPIGVIMPGCDPVLPDFVVVLKDNAAIIHDKRIWGPPNVLIEILSPSISAYDVEVKLVAYARAGVPEYAIINPRARTLTHYQHGATAGSYDTPRVYGQTDTMSFTCLPSISLPIGALFAGAPDTEL